MTGLDIIPEMTDPMGRHWVQPNRKDLFFCNIRVHLTIKDFNLLRDYSWSNPTGTYAGKMWKAFYKGAWQLEWWIDDKQPGYVLLQRKLIRVVGAARSLKKEKGQFVYENQ